MLCTVDEDIWWEKHRIVSRSFKVGQIPLKISAEDRDKVVKLFPMATEGALRCQGNHEVVLFNIVELYYAFGKLTVEATLIVAPEKLLNMYS